MAPLPAPGTRTEQFLAAVIDELRGLRADLARGGEQPAQSDDDGGSTELREPKPAASKPAAKKTTGRRPKS